MDLLAVDHCPCRGDAPGATPVRATSPMISWILSSTCETTTSSCPNPVVIMEWFVQCIFCFHFQVKTFSFNFSYYASLCWQSNYSITNDLPLVDVLSTCNISTDTLENHVYFVQVYFNCMVISLLLKFFFFFLKPFLVVILEHAPEYLHTAFRGYYYASNKQPAMCLQFTIKWVSS